jgi:RND family efflux transporter MFP subunit
MESIALDLARLEAERDIELRSRIAAAAFRTSEASRIENLATRKLTPQIAKERADMEQELAAFGVRAAEMDQKVARIRLRMAQAALDRRTIRSSVSGVVIETSAAPGEYVNEQSTIVTIVQLDVLNVEVFLPTAQFGLTTEGEIATVMPEAPIGGEYPATVETIDRMYDAASGTFGVRLKLHNDDYRLPAGLRCRVVFSGERAPE